MTTYYNEIDPYAAAWLRNLIAAEHIAPGDVDERSIVDVRPDDLKGYTQVHFFAGIGGWSLAARLAGWPDARRLWTGSCPCQPYSAAGKRKGAEDARNLWPEMRRLVRACRPDVVAGEQVASKDGRIWLAGVRTDLEDVAYDFWSADSCSAGVGAPHIRQRLWWLADADGGVAGNGDVQSGRQYGQQPQDDGAVRLADAGTSGRRALQRSSATSEYAPLESDRLGEAMPVVRMGDSNHTRSQGRLDGPGESGRSDQRLVGPASQLGFWSRYDVVHCTDGKARRFEPGSFPLAHGVSNRVGRLRAYGNAINPWLAAEVLAAYLDGRGLRVTSAYDVSPDGVFA